MEKGRKIRNLIDKDDQAVSLQDVIFKASELSAPLIDLEYNNKKTVYDKANKIMRELKGIVSQLDKRLRNEVYEEVMDAKLANKHRYKGNVDNLKKNNNQ